MFFSLSTPIGLSFPQRPSPGHSNDSPTMHATNFVQQMQQIFVNGRPIASAGDGIFPWIGPHILRRHLGELNNLTPVQEAENLALSPIRTALCECPFGQVSNSFQTMTFSQQMKFGVNRPDSWYLLSTLLHNMRACIRQTNNTVSYFRKKMHARAMRDYLYNNGPAPLDEDDYLPLPSIHDYLHGIV